MAEQTGMKNLYGIMDYCTDISRLEMNLGLPHVNQSPSWKRVWDTRVCQLYIIP